MKTIPKISAVLPVLFKADLITQWRNRRAVMLSLLIPVIILVAWKDLVGAMGGAFVLASCITIGLNAIGLIGYPNSIARDRDKGVFQRLRITPIPKWTIMCSRLVVQLFLIFLACTIVFIVGYFFADIKISPIGYLLAYLTVTLGGIVYLGMGQVIVGLISNPETVNSTGRLLYFVFFMVGMFGQTGMIGQQLKEICGWSPYGTVQLILTASMKPGIWDKTAAEAFLLTLVYAVSFATLGIKKFKWITKE